MITDTDDHAGRRVALAAICLAALLMPLSFTGPSVATPAIGRDLGGGPIALAWIMNAMILAFGCSIMAAGTLADQYGRKRMFRLGLIGFTIVSIALGFSPNILVLDLLRAVQGTTAALALAGGAASLAYMFEGLARTRAYSLLGTSFGVGLAFGPILSGVLIETFGWRSVFFAGAFLTSVAIVFGVPKVPESRDPGAIGVDWLGAGLFTIALLFFTFGVMEAPGRGWGSPLIVFLFAASVLGFAAFVVAEVRQRRPMLDVSLFKYPRFVAVQALPLATAFAFVVPLVLLPARFIGIEGMGEVEAGLMMFPLCAPLLVVPFLGGLMARKIPSGVLSAGGLAIAAAGLAWLATVPPGADRLAFALPLIVVGIGSGVPWGLMDDLAVSVVPKERAGMATGIFGTMRVAGEAVALALIGALLAGLVQAGLQDRVGKGDPELLARLPDLASRLAAGDLRIATDTLPADVLTGIHGAAFSVMVGVLSAITLVAATGAFLAFRRPQAQSVNVAEASAVVPAE